MIGPYHPLNHDVDHPNLPSLKLVLLDAPVLFKTELEMRKSLCNVHYLIPHYVDDPELGPMLLLLCPSVCPAFGPAGPKLDRTVRPDVYRGRIIEPNKFNLKSLVTFTVE
jgi:hypothetical protein